MNVTNKWCHRYDRFGVDFDVNDSNNSARLFLASTKRAHIHTHTHSQCTHIRGWDERSLNIMIDASCRVCGVCCLRCIRNVSRSNRHTSTRLPHTPCHTLAHIQIDVRCTHSLHRSRLQNTIEMDGSVCVFIEKFDSSFFSAGVSSRVRTRYASPRSHESLSPAYMLKVFGRFARHSASWFGTFCCSLFRFRTNEEFFVDSFPNMLNYFSKTFKPSP